MKELNLALSEQVLTHFFGTTNTVLIIACFSYGCLGVMIMILMDIMGRDKTNDKFSPKEFKMSFFWKDNRSRFFLNFLLMLIAIRFQEKITGKPVDESIACAIGLGSDMLALYIKKRKQKFAEDNQLVDRTTLTNRKEVSNDGKNVINSTEVEQIKSAS